jgi:hypothetical protein
MEFCLGKKWTFQQGLSSKKNRIELNVVVYTSKIPELTRQNKNMKPNDLFEYACPKKEFRQQCS